MLYHRYWALFIHKYIGVFQKVLNLTQIFWFVTHFSFSMGFTCKGIKTEIWIRFSSFKRSGSLFPQQNVLLWVLFWMRLRTFRKTLEANYIIHTDLSLSLSLYIYIYYIYLRVCACVRVCVLYQTMLFYSIFIESFLWFSVGETNCYEYYLTLWTFYIHPGA